MIIASTAMLVALIAPASPLSTIPARASYPVSGAVTAQLAPKEDGARRPTVCTEQYAPVCGRINGVLKTYSNQCFARADGADVIAQRRRSAHRCGSKGCGTTRPFRRATRITASRAG